MTKKTDTIAKRLAELFSLGPRLSVAVQKLEEEKGPAAKVVSLDWNEILPDRVEPIITIFSLDPSLATDQAIITAFNKAGLDPKNPIHWKALLSFFAYAHFGKWPSSGRPKKWTDKSYSILLHDFFAIKNAKPHLSVDRACGMLKQRHPEKYKQSKERLAKEVKRAQDPKFHPALAHFLNVMLQLSKAEYQERHLAWNPDVEARKRKEHLELALRHVGRKKPQKTDATSASIEK
jgi:hypothetical protein